MNEDMSTTGRWMNGCEAEPRRKGMNSRLPLQAFQIGAMLLVFGSQLVIGKEFKGMVVGPPLSTPSGRNKPAYESWTGGGSSLPAEGASSWSSDSVNIERFQLRRDPARSLALIAEDHRADTAAGQPSGGHGTSTPFVVDPFDIAGDYWASFEFVDESMEIRQRGTGFHLLLDAFAESGCSASVEGDAVLDGNVLTLSVRDVDYENMYPEEGREPVMCIVTASFGPGGAFVSTNRCEGFHGVPCEFGAGLLTKH
jgi:hypothetical protein